MLGLMEILMDGKTLHVIFAQHFACWVKISADNVLKYFSCFS